MPFIRSGIFLHHVYSLLMSDEFGKDLFPVLYQRNILKMPELMSKRFLTSYLLLSCDAELREKITERLHSLQTSIPLIINGQCLHDGSMISCFKVNDHVADVMTEGVGVLQFGQGRAACEYTGKSQFLNDFLNRSFDPEIFETQDRNAFSSNHVDIFFNDKSDTVFMDV